MARKMKSSGIEWIGDIPEDWKTIKLLFVLNRPITDGPHETPSYVDEGVPFITINNIDDAGNIDKENANKISSKDAITYNNKAKMKVGDLLFSKSATIGRIAEVDKLDFMVWSPFAILSPNTDIINKLYLKLLLTLPGYIDHIIGLGSVNTQVNVGMRAMEKSIIPLPNIEQQTKIADFLDEKTNQIEQIKTALKQEIQTLEDYKKSVITEAVTKGLDKNVAMKDSGIEWIGEIPKHWETKKGKYILSLLKKSVKENDEVITCFRDGQVTLRSNRREEGFTFADKEIGYQGVDVGDLVVHGMDGFAGAIGISDSRGKASPVLNVIDSKEDKKYIMYYLRTMAYSDVFVALATGIRVRSVDLRWNKLSNLPYPIPPINEQIAISRYVDKKLANTNELINKKQKQLESLEEYKKSLIYEYVTGKKEVAEC